PSLAEPHYNLGVIMGQQGKLAEAQDEFRRAIQLHLTLAKAHYNLGVVYARTGRLQEARLELENARSLDPTLPDTLAFLGEMPSPQRNGGARIKPLRIRVPSPRPRGDEGNQVPPSAYLY